MVDPELTPAERHLVERVLHEGTGLRLLFELASLGPAAVLAAIGLMERSTAALAAALAIVFAFRIVAVVYDHRTLPVLRSAVAKLVQARRVDGGHPLPRSDIAP